MIEVCFGDLLTAPVDIICHQVNCRGVMGAGIAKQIADKYPLVKENYQTLCSKNKETPYILLGDISVVNVLNKSLVGYQCPSYIINMFAQDSYGRGGQYTSYSAFQKCLDKVHSAAQFLHDPRSEHKIIIGFPRGIGCGLGGGYWNIIYEYIRREFEDSYVCNVQIWNKIKPSEQYGD